MFCKRAKKIKRDINRSMRHMNKNIANDYLWRGRFDFSFYPRMADTDLSFEGICFYALFAVFVFIPFIFGVTEAVKWKYLRSKI